MASICFTGFRFRATRGGTPDKALALSQRGEGGPLLPVGTVDQYRYVMMSKVDERLSWSERERLIDLRKGCLITEIDLPSEVAAISGPQIEHPELSSSRESVQKINWREATEFPRLAPSQRTGLVIIDMPKLPFKIVYKVFAGVSLQAGRGCAQELNQLEGSNKYRIPTLTELSKIREPLREQGETVREQLEGANYWIWTETKDENYPGQFVVGRLDSEALLQAHPGIPYSSHAVILIKER